MSSVLLLGRKHYEKRRALMLTNIKTKNVASEETNANSINYAVMPNIFAESNEVYADPTHNYKKSMDSMEQKMSKSY